MLSFVCNGWDSRWLLPIYIYIYMCLHAEVHVENTARVRTAIFGTALLSLESCPLILSSWVFNVLFGFGKCNSTLPIQSVWLPQKRVQLGGKEPGSGLECPQLLVTYGHFCCSLLNVLIRKARAKVLSGQHTPEGWRCWGPMEGRRAHPFPLTVPMESAGFRTQRTFACCKQSTTLGKHLPRLLRICVPLKHTWTCAGATSQVPSAVCSQPATKRLEAPFLHVTASMIQIQAVYLLG